MTRRQPTTPATPDAANDNNLLTIDRAIADGLCPTSLRQIADANLKAARKGENSARLLRQADNLHKIADKLELLGYGRAA
ncbi:hypothetical protein CN090_04525 [Sinorhizobium meliloti]|uniref:hypothetical protein n=1 Tax=Rhizobium meliloti TaxID=382 RepID=UPI000FDA71E1|nr:hypothetical protein [Sinorhizobium meliloti]RVO55186.1 hypothetical protein CN090_04525 [Sinorhizobium meliloti]